MAVASNLYTVIGTDSNGCTGMASQSVTVNSLPNVGSTALPSSTVCYGTNVTLNGTGAINYTWNNNVVNGQPFMAVASNTYRVIGIDSNGCRNTSSIMITVNSLPNPSIIAVGPTTFCDGGSVTLDAGVWSSYLWNDNNTNETKIVTNTGNYMVTITDMNGCTGMASQSVTVNSLPIVGTMVSPSATVCYGTNVTLNGTGAINYIWNNNVVNGQPFMAVASNLYTVIGTDSNGCTGMASQMVNVNSLPIVGSMASPSSTVCYGTNVTLNGTGAVNYNWNNNVVNGVPFMAVASNTYNIIGIDSNGCRNISSKMITVNSLPIASITAVGQIGRA